MKIKYLIVLIAIFMLCGCEENNSIENQEEHSIDCGFKYTYTCGYEVSSGQCKCGYGYFYTCN